MVAQISSKAAKYSKPIGKTKKKPRGRPFKSNNPVTGEKDMRINRTGQPRIMADLRELVLDVLNEPVEKKNEEGKVVSSQSKLKIMLDIWYLSQDYNKQNKLLELGYGKVPDERIERTEQNDFVAKYIHVFTDGEIDRIQQGESGFDILVSKLEMLLKQQNESNVEK